MYEKDPITDRRIARTRRLLSQALVDLLQERAYDRITVQDILDRADIGRSTFYAHYRSKDDLLARDFERMLDQLGTHLEAGEGSAQPVISVEALFAHVKEHYGIYRALVRGEGVELVFRKGQDYLSRKIEAHLAGQLPPGRTLDTPLPFLAHYMAGSLILMLRWWLDRNMPYTPERMAQLYLRLVEPGIRSIMAPATINQEVP